ncbi:DUF4190 domain-containing protein [Arthrobacter roseus]|uniref:DUF4190 domain-containing protein n=1 Tax=Arthrobacter roseus TaxID=136274 RepID=UPI001966319E|nr:DUF4190 domain-containing protein [Arthrobacter roseus]MBM7847264.1 hypothetical protein [Arthrobacter roseus]
MSSSTNEPSGGDGHDDASAPPHPHSNPYAEQGYQGQSYQGQSYQGPPPGENQYQQYPQQYGPQPGYYPPAYGQPVYMMPPAAPKNLSITSLVLGVASMVGFAFFLVPQVLAVIFGHLGLKREPEGRGMAIGGLVMGYICIAGWLAVVILYALIIGMALSTSEISDSYNT